MKYRALHIISTIFKVLGWVMLVLGVLGSCASSALTATGSLGLLGNEEAAGIGGMFGAVMFLVGGLMATGLYVLCLFAIGEGIQVILGIEENTRQMAQALRERA